MARKALQPALQPAFQASLERAPVPSDQPILLRHLAEAIQFHGLFSNAEPLLVGMSGGVDSVVMAHALHSLGYTLRLAHVNYGLRGNASEGDALFVADFAQKWGISLESLRVQKPDHASVQTWARDVRYAWFSRLAGPMFASKVVVAHHADDQLETVLLNVLRGTGLAGLVGMKWSRPLGSGVQLVRPMLSISKREILEYASFHGLEWREDASNQDLRYARNAIRSELAGMSEADYDAFVDAGRRLTRRMSGLRDVIFSMVPAVERQTGDQSLCLTTVQWEALQWEALPSFIRGWVVHEILLLLDPKAPRRRSGVKVMERLARSEVGKKAHVGSVTVWRERGGFVFKSARTESVEPQLVDLSTEHVLVRSADGVLSGGIMTGNHSGLNAAFVRSQSPGEAWLDADTLTGPVVLRPWLPGDRFSPLGLKGHQKVKSFLTNQKISASERKQLNVLVADGSIVWVVGHRIADPFKLTDQTRRVLHLKWDSGKVREEG